MLNDECVVTNPAPASTVPGNCYDALTELQTTLASFGVKSSSISDSLLYNMECSYGIAGVSNAQIQAGFATYISKVGCCFGNQMAMIQQNPVVCYNFVYFLLFS